MILHYISDDSTGIKVTSTTLSAKVFLEGDQNAGNVISVPSRTNEAVTQSKNKSMIKEGLPQKNQILNHFFAQIMVDTVDLVLGEKTVQVFGENGRRFWIMTKRLFDNNTSPWVTEKK